MSNIYETHKMKDPRVPFIFHDFTLSCEKYSTVHNWHENLEIIYVVSGGGFLICEGETVSIETGDIAVINPNRLHGFSTSDAEMRYYCIIIDRSFFISNHFDSNDYEFDVRIRDGELSRLIEIFGQLFNDRDDSFKVQKLRYLALEIGTVLCEKYARPHSSERIDTRSTACIKQAIGFIRAEYYRDISLDEICDFVGISKFYFAREFKRITGRSFVSYLNLIRCEKARELLLDGTVNIGEVGRECGFESHSYFCRAFKDYSGQTPGEYRKNNR